MIPKFRFFDTEENKMHVVDSLYTFKSFGGKDITIATEDAELSEWRSYSDGVLMQSTGLFDKNGKEIFEGDIVIQTSYLNENYKPNNIVVEWDEWNCEFNISRTFNYEIIGNKYQHPHLLEEE